MKFNCTFCGGKIEGEESWIGLESECPYCNMQITVPEPLVRDGPSSPVPTEANTALVEVEGSETEAGTAKLATAGKETNSDPANRFGRWLGGGVLVLIVIAFVIAVFKGGSAETPHRGASNPSSTANPPGKQKANRGAYDLYMTGYNDPEKAEIANYVISGASDEDKKALMLINLGANDRKNGLPVRFELVE